MGRNDIGLQTRVEGDYHISRIIVNGTEMIQVYEYMIAPMEYEMNASVNDWLRKRSLEFLNSLNALVEQAMITNSRVVAISM